ncbi:unnamed protein product [Caenorhabditis sp. 36 PRJEB53466]|nr:unnamed protein product [Caenorhabditis sp. 36 PRJEB53466]
MADYYARCGEARSVSDGESDGERRLRRSRRKRGGTTTRYKPNGLSPEYVEEDENEEKEERSMKKRRKKADKRDRYGMAPPNSTQFLLDDREARADVEYENEQKFEAAERRRIRSMSGSLEHFSRNAEPTTTTTTTTLPTIATGGTACGSSDGSVSGEENEAADREREREFETDYLEVKRERIQSMTKSQLAQELLERDHDTQLLAQELGSKESENRHLRQLLSAHGICPDAPVSSSTSSPPSPPQQCHVASSSKSPEITAQ